MWWLPHALWIRRELTVKACIPSMWRSTFVRTAVCTTKRDKELLDPRIGFIHSLSAFVSPHWLAYKERHWPFPLVRLSLVFGTVALESRRDCNYEQGIMYNGVTLLQQSSGTSVNQNGYHFYFPNTRIWGKGKRVIVVTWWLMYLIINIHTTLDNSWSTKP